MRPLPRVRDAGRRATRPAFLATIVVVLAAVPVFIASQAAIPLGATSVLVDGRAIATGVAVLLLLWSVSLARVGSSREARRRELTIARARADQVARRLAPYEERERARFHRMLELDRVLADRSAINTVYQPIMDFARGAVVGVEALSRFHHEPRRSPVEWFQQAWEVGRGVDLEILTMLGVMTRLDELPEDQFVAVNLSPATLVSPEFARVMPEQSWHRVVVELTEHARIEDYDALQRPVAEIRERGGRLAVDDVGAGFASLQHVLRLMPDLVKLDMSLTRNINQDPARHALASGVIACAEQLGAAVVGEGIQTWDELEALRGMGVGLGQGFFISEPLDLEVLRVGLPEDRILDIA